MERKSIAKRPKLLIGPPFHYCPGCSHGIVHRLLAEIIEELNSRDLRSKFRVIVGGAPITKEWANEIGADGYGADALEAVEIARKLTGLV